MTAWSAMRALFGFLAALVVFASTGCVPQSQLDAALAERNSVADENAALEAKRDELTLEITRLEARLHRAELSNEDLSTMLAETEKQVSELRGTYNSLVSNLEEELASGQVEIEQLRNGIRLNLSDEILFKSGSATLDAGGREVLGKVADEIVRLPHVVVVSGHTDNVPIAGGLAKRYPTNWELAGARAAVVVRLLEDRGLPGSRLQAVSRGEHDPVADNESVEGRAKNRRTEIRLRPVEEDEGGEEIETGEEGSESGPDAGSAPEPDSEYQSE